MPDYTHTASEYSYALGTAGSLTPLARGLGLPTIYDCPARVGVFARYRWCYPMRCSK
jgi:hypothetical protein